MAGLGCVYGGRVRGEGVGWARLSLLLCFSGGVLCVQQPHVQMPFISLAITRRHNGYVMASSSSMSCGENRARDFIIGRTQLWCGSVHVLRAEK